MKTKKEKPVRREMRDVLGKNILFVNDEAVGEVRRKDDFYYDPGNVVQDVATGVRCIGYLLESISEAGNEPVDPMVCWGLSQALQHYADDCRKYLREKAQSAV
jgi:hypothetical protein